MRPDRLIRDLRALPRASRASAGTDLPTGRTARRPFPLRDASSERLLAVKIRIRARKSTQRLVPSGCSLPPTASRRLRHRGSLHDRAHDRRTSASVPLSGVPSPVRVFDGTDSDRDPCWRSARHRRARTRDSPIPTIPPRDVHPAFRTFLNVRACRPACGGTRRITRARGPNVGVVAPVSFNCRLAA